MNERSALDWGATPDGAPKAYQSYLVPGMFTALADIVADASGAGPGSRVLDIACGTGALSRRLGQAGGSVTGIDLAPPMLAVARELSVGIAFMEGSADALPFPDDSFDVVTCQQGLQFFPDRAAAVTEMRRVLQPGGRAVIACWCDPTQGGIVLIEQALRRHMGEEAAAMSRAPFVIDNASILEELLADAGFSDVKVWTETIAARFVPGLGFGGRFIAAQPMAEFFAAAPAEVRAAVDADVDEGIQPMLDGDAAAFPMPSLVATATA
jgi:ubiquinone/menaquinone biosynthesis C-methylase UbiE